MTSSSPLRFVRIDDGFKCIQGPSRRTRVGRLILAGEGLEQAVAHTLLTAVTVAGVYNQWRPRPEWCGRHARHKRRQELIQISLIGSASALAADVLPAREGRHHSSRIGPRSTHGVR